MKRKDKDTAMKKILVIILALILCFSLVACTQGEDGSGSGGSGGTSAGGTSGGSSGGSSGTSGGSGGASGGQTYQIVYSHTNNEESSTHFFGVDLIARLDELAPGRFTQVIYSNGQLGADRENIEAVQNGDVTYTCSSTAPQANFVTEVEVLDLPFIFNDIEAGRKTMQDERFLSVMRDAYAAKGFYLMSFVDVGFRISTTDTLAAHVPDDFKGFNMRTMENANHMLLWRSLGANPTPIAYTELYTALQQGTVRGQENPYENVSVKKFYEVQDYIIGTNHVYMASSFICNLAWYQSLDAEAQETFDAAIAYGVDKFHDFVDSHEEVFIKEFEDYGCTCYKLTPEEMSLFQEKTQPVYDSVKEHMDAINSTAYDVLVEVASGYAA